MKNLVPRTQRGFSLIEILIILVVIGIIVTIAVAQFGDSSTNLERQNVAREFKISLERARFDSVKRHATSCADMARVEITSPTAFRLVADQNQNGTVLAADGVTVDPGDIRAVNFQNRGQVNIVGNSLVFPIVYRFDQNGHVSTGPCPISAAAVPTTTFCNMPCTAATADAANSNIVFVSATGTSSILTGGEVLPTFDDPDAANINASTNIDSRLTIWNGTPITPTPLPPPSGTPPPPLTTPTPASSPGPSDTPTPTPEPSPNACVYGQKVNGSPKCTCYDPLKVVKNTCVGATPTPTP